MTKAACQLILNIGVWGLTWRSIQHLSQPGWKEQSYVEEEEVDASVEATDERTKDGPIGDDGDGDSNFGSGNNTVVKKDETSDNEDSEVANGPETDMKVKVATEKNAAKEVFRLETIDYPSDPPYSNEHSKQTMQPMSYSHQPPPPIMDLEILQLWSLVALHKLYVHLGIEWFLSFIPLYYYIKMLLLIITFTPHTRFPNFWYELILIPLMTHIHQLLLIDWKAWIQREAMLLPWRIVDLVLFPGLLHSEDELREVKKVRMEQMIKAEEDFQVQTRLKSKSRSKSKSKSPRRKAPTPSVVRTQKKAPVPPSFAFRHSPRSRNKPVDHGIKKNERQPQRRVVKQNDQSPKSRGVSKDGSKGSTTPKAKANNKAKSRPSIGDRIRNYITGDSSIRLRDYLFDVDLDVKSPPSPESPSKLKSKSPRTKGKEGSLPTRRYGARNDVTRTNRLTTSSTSRRQTSRTKVEDSSLPPRRMSTRTEKTSRMDSTSATSRRQSTRKKVEESSLPPRRSTRTDVASRMATSLAASRQSTQKKDEERSFPPRSSSTRNERSNRMTNSRTQTGGRSATSRTTMGVDTSSPTSPKNTNPASARKSPASKTPVTSPRKAPTLSVNRSKSQPTMEKGTTSKSENISVRRSRRIASQQS